MKGDAGYVNTNCLVSIAHQDTTSEACWTLAVLLLITISSPQNIVFPIRYDNRTYVFELLFLHEALDGWSLAGSGLILGYMLVVAILKLIRESEYIPSEETELLPFADDTETGMIPTYDTHTNNER